MRKIIIGDIKYDVIKYKSYIKKNEWANCLPCSIKIKINAEDCQNLKFIVDKFGGDFNFISIGEDGIYFCNSVLQGINITSKIKDNVICKLDIIIWTQLEMESSESKSLVRNTVLDDVLGF